MKRNLYIYGITYQNANKIPECIESLRQFKATKIFVVDNYFTDGSYELLKKQKNISVVRERSTRGRARNLGRILLLKEAKPTDLVMRIDFDTVYTKAAGDLIRKLSRIVRDGEIYNPIEFSTARTQMVLPWMEDLSGSEDGERFARAISEGMKLYYVGNMTDSTRFQLNEVVPSNEFRSARYVKGYNVLRKYMNYFRLLVDENRGGALKSFSEFYDEHLPKKFRSPYYFVGYLAAYVVAHFTHIYSYDKTLSNRIYLTNNWIRLSYPKLKRIPR